MEEMDELRDLMKEIEKILSSTRYMSIYELRELYTPRKEEEVFESMRHRFQIVLRKIRHDDDL
jgi:ElaB/YqjD/DUF883 family membrane-anchored ribosome-binding protein